MISRRQFTAAAACAVLLATAAPAAAGQAKLSVVATTSMIADAARQVGGERVEVRALMGPGVDPHAYRQTRSDIAAMLGADIVLWHGLYLEAQMEEFLLELAARKPAIAVGEAVPVERRRAHVEYKGRFDPHVWMSPELWRYVVGGVRDALTGIDPEGAALYAANAERHLLEIDGLIAYAKATLATVPDNQRVLVTAHDAFAYFGQAYGLEVLGIQGISTESEAGLRRIEDLVQVIVDRKVSAVFIESSVSDRNIRALIEGAAARGHQVAIGGELYSDAMGAEGTYEGTYLGMLDHNITVIARALGGEAPERGMMDALSVGL